MVTRTGKPPGSNLSSAEPPKDWVELNCPLPAGPYSDPSPLELTNRFPYAWGDECPTRTFGRSNAGKQSAVTSDSFSLRASLVICRAADGQRQALLHWAYDSRKL